MGRQSTMGSRLWWWWDLFLVLLKTLQLSFVCGLMRIKFLIDPSARKRDLEEITRSYNLPPEGFKYLQWRNEYTVSKFFYTWKMIEDFFKTNLQDINKTARLYCSAPNPSLQSALTGASQDLLSAASTDLPLVINFGSCT